MNQFAIGIFLICLLLQLSTCATDCDKSKCPGPTQYYRDLGCKPIYENLGDCCAYKYNCDQIKKRSKSKCYVNGHAYKIGESLKDEDANPCDISCKCLMGFDGTAAFQCAIVDCFHGPVKPGCYRKNSPIDCCPGEEVCPVNPKDRAKCVVDGKTYRDGEHFSVKSEPDLNCVCAPGYKGKNVEPFCAFPKRPYCDPYFRHSGDVRNNCAPVYYSNQSPQNSCSVFSRCQNDEDEVIKADDSDKNIVCQFGSLVLHGGDELNQATDYSSVCVKCVCEVGPTLTCQRLPDSECDVTNHEPFDHQ